MGRPLVGHISWVRSHALWYFPTGISLWHLCCELTCSSWPRLGAERAVFSVLNLVGSIDWSGTDFFNSVSLLSRQIGKQALSMCAGIRRLASPSAGAFVSRVTVRSAAPNESRVPTTRPRPPYLRLTYGSGT